MFFERLLEKFVFCLKLFIDRFRYNANRASQVQSKIKLLEKLYVDSFFSFFLSLKFALVSALISHFVEDKSVCYD